MTAGAKATGIILTGMGNDGASGMQKMHEQGAYTIAQNEKSCVVYGMPGAAVAAGGVDVQLSPSEMTEYLIRCFGCS